MPLAELLWTQAWSGAPLYLLAGVAQALWLHPRMRLGILPLVSIGLFTTLLAILAGVVIWGRFFGPNSVMLWQTINLPALLASLVVFPLVAVLLRAGFSDT